jgi:hypothetical protein
MVRAGWQAVNRVQHPEKLKREMPLKAVRKREDGDRHPASCASTEHAELRTAVEGAVKAICSRVTDKQASAQGLLAALEQAKNPAARTSLLRLLIYTRGDAALQAVRRAMQDANAEVAETAFRTSRSLELLPKLLPAIPAHVTFG